MAMRCLCVFSGGLDSILAAQVVRAQGIDVLAVFFQTPFFGPRRALETAAAIKLPIKIIDITDRHMEVVRRPKHGYGSHMNPCIDCHALMFRVAGELLSQEQARFVLTGEVLGQRPMSQHKRALELIGRLSGIPELLLRPLSARLLPPTLPELEGWVDRDRLPALQGRSRKPQLALARAMGITTFPQPGGGCLLTEAGFSARLRDLLARAPEPSRAELELLQVGRHFRLAEQVRAVVGRNQQDNAFLARIAGEAQWLLTSVTVPGPTVLLLGEPDPATLERATCLVLAYSDTLGLDSARIRMARGGTEQTVTASVVDKREFKDELI